jgi:hypothetical protein
MVSKTLGVHQAMITLLFTADSTRVRFRDYVISLIAEATGFFNE